MKLKYIFWFEIFKVIGGIVNIIFLAEQHPTLSLIVSFASILTSFVVAGAGAVAGVGVVVVAGAGAVAGVGAVAGAGAVAVAVAGVGVVAGVVAGAIDNQEEPQTRTCPRCKGSGNIPINKKEAHHATRY